ncbi:MAG: hypothetical protein LC803_23860 [Acidobacteria bacterium]|nr:hypothetical protein [Acidobacteriota bacterium]
MATKKKTSSKGASKSAEKASPLKFAATAGGSRTFAGAFTVTWTPSATTAQLTVTITAGGALLTSTVFIPDNATQAVSGSNGTFSVDGVLIAVFNSGGMTGTLLAQPMNFNSPTTGKQTFSGAVGLW